jgi:rare lipoprotein A
MALHRRTPTASLSTPRKLALLALALAGSDACRTPTRDAQGAPAPPPPAAPAEPTPPPPAAHTLQTGQATYYSDALAGRRTASGERYDPRALTAAHRTLAFGTLIRVVRADDGRAVVVRVNDRGPFSRPDRIIDLSRAAAEAIEMTRAGVVPVRIEIVENR